MRHSVCARPGLSYLRGEPQDCYQHWHEALGEGAAALLLVDFELHPWWLDQAAPIPLTALYCLDASGLRVAVTELALCDAALSATDLFHHWVAQHRLLAAEPGVALELLPTAVAKPWGREVWYSAVESRGVCRVGNEASCTPLPWLQAVLPDNAAGTPGQALVLLKILEPSPEPVLGDLYFELHESKREVYVVTDIDLQAWPDGTGYIRFGFSAKKRAAASNDQQFRTAYLAAVRSYELVRRTLDAKPVAEAPEPHLLQQERMLREKMDSFTDLRPLRRGDVVVVPPRLPHALLHGVRVVEFQSPVYERKILSFAQRVLTQTHWDTEAALETALLAPPQPPSFTPLACCAGVHGERIVQFSDFEVCRYRIAVATGFTPEASTGYRLVMVLAGELALAGQRYAAGQALILPRGWRGALAPATAAQALDLLLAKPCS